MTKEKIIDMAIEAGWDAHHAEFDTRIQTFAALVIANHPPQSFMTWQEGYEAGKQTEREACAKMCDDLDDDLPDGLAGWQYGEAIRARGKHDTR